MVVEKRIRDYSKRRRNNDVRSNCSNRLIWLRLEGHHEGGAKEIKSGKFEF
jgi:hypothetical protein